MKLQAYLRWKNQTATDFAKEIGVHKQAVSRYLNGRMPRPAIMRAILSATEGMVTPMDWLIEPRPKRRKPQKAKGAL
jgi:transcriptional regulator with XRE-family HTH domain